MTATLTITFEDGTAKTIVLANAIEMNVSAERKQSIEFRETSSGEWVMAFTKPLLEGRKFSSISVRKEV